MHRTRARTHVLSCLAVLLSHGASLANTLVAHIVADSTTPLHSMPWLGNQGFKYPHISPDGYIAFSLNAAVPSPERLWIVQAPDGQRRTLDRNTPISYINARDDEPPLYEQDRFTLCRGGLVIVGGSERKGFTSNDAWLYGELHALRLLYRLGDQVPDMPTGFTWQRFPFDGPRLRSDGVAFGLGDFLGPNAEQGDAIVRADSMGERSVVVRTGEPLLLADGGSVVPQVLRQLEVTDRSLVFVAGDGSSIKVIRFNAEGSHILLDTSEGESLGLTASEFFDPSIDSVNRRGDVLIQVQLDEDRSRSALVLVTADGVRRPVTLPDQPIDDQGTTIRTVSGIIGASGRIVALASLNTDHLGSPVRALLLDDGNGLQTMLRTGDSLSPPGGSPAPIDQIRGGPMINARGQVMVTTGALRRDLPYMPVDRESYWVWDDHSGWSLVLQQNAEVNGVSGILGVSNGIWHYNMPWLTSTDASQRSLISDLGQVFYTTNMQDYQPFLLTTMIPSPGLADANADAICDGRDLSVLLSNFGNPVSPPGSGADFNADAVVNGADLSILLSAFGS